MNEHSLMVSVLNDSLEDTMAPKGKKAAPAPFPQGRAGGAKKPAKVMIRILEHEAIANSKTEPAHRKAPEELRHRPGYSTRQELVAHGEVACLCPPPAPEEDPQSSSE